MWGCHTPTLFYATPPPLSLWRKACGPQWHEKHPKFAPQTGSENRVAPVRRIVVNRDSFRKFRPLAFNPPFPERGIVRIGPRRQGVRFAASRPGRLRADPKDALLTSGKGGCVGSGPKGTFRSLGYPGFGFLIRWIYPQIQSLLLPVLYYLFLTICKCVVNARRIEGKSVVNARTVCVVNARGKLPRITQTCGNRRFMVF